MDPGIDKNYRRIELSSGNISVSESLVFWVTPGVLLMISLYYTHFVTVIDFLSASVSFIAGIIVFWMGMGTLFRNRGIKRGSWVTLTNISGLLLMVTGVRMFGLYEGFQPAYIFIVYGTGVIIKESLFGYSGSTGVLEIADHELQYIDKGGKPGPVISLSELKSISLKGHTFDFTYNDGKINHLTLSNIVNLEEIETVLKEYVK